MIRRWLLAHVAPGPIIAAVEENDPPKNWVGAYFAAMTPAIEEQNVAEKSVATLH